MNIPDILDKITNFILHFDLVKFLKGTKGVVVIIAIVAMFLILIGAFFSLIPQF